MIGVEHRARDFEGETLRPGRCDAFTGKCDYDTGDLKYAKQHDRGDAHARTSRSINKARDKQRYRDSDAEQGGEGGGDETGRPRRSDPKYNYYRESTENSCQRRARPLGTFDEGAVQKRRAHSNEDAHRR
jgi:hypothetical protein